MKSNTFETINETYEEIFHDYEIYIEPNPDNYRGGCSWSISRGDLELDCGLARDKKEALSDAHKAVAKVLSTKNST